MRKHTPNVAVRQGDGVWLNVTGGVVPSAVVDDADYPRIALYRWRVGARGHVVTCVGSERRTIYLARLLTKARADERVFHKNGDLLDFTRGNLEKRRIVRKVRPARLTL
jgi:hypothetical protein